MPRRRSTAIRHAQPGWHDIHQERAREFLGEHGHAFFEQRLAKAKRLEIEVGSGSGSFLLQAAQNQPETLFVGIEYSGKFMRLFRDRMLAEKLENILLLATDARAFLMGGLPPASVDAFHVYFPDPWHRHRAQKKRTLGKEGLPLLKKALKPGGAIYFTTDHEQYFRDVEKILPEHPDLKIEQNRTVTQETKAATPYVASYGGSTHFGERYLKLGKPVFSLVLQFQPMAEI